MKTGERVKIMGTIIEATKKELSAGEYKTELLIKTDSGEYVIVWSNAVKIVKNTINKRGAKPCVKNSIH